MGLLNGEQKQHLSSAILSAFSASDLEMLVRFELNERLDNIVASGPFVHVVFQVIEWAEKNDRITDLVQAVSRARPNNKSIQEIAYKLSTPNERPAPHAGNAPLDGLRRARLRAVFGQQFPTRSSIKMLVDDTLSVNLDKIIGPAANLEETIFELIQWASVDPASHLRPILSEALRLRPNSEELKDLYKELFEAG